MRKVLSNRKVGYSLMIFSLIGMIMLVRTLISTYQSGRRVNRLASEVDQIRLENESLAKQKDEWNQSNMIEKEAREKLNLVHPGDYVVIIDRDEGDTVVSVDNVDTSRFNSEISIPQQWTDLIRLGLP